MLSAIEGKLYTLRGRRQGILSSIVVGRFCAFRGRRQVACFPRLMAGYMLSAVEACSLQ